MKILKFCGANCPSCKLITPTINSISKELSIDLEEYDIEQNPTETSQYSIRSIPTVIILKNQVEVDRIVGPITPEEYIEKINSYL